jgi:hypothetical protein
MNDRNWPNSVSGVCCASVRFGLKGAADAASRNVRRMLTRGAGHPLRYDTNVKASRKSQDRATESEPQHHKSGGFSSRHARRRTRRTASALWARLGCGDLRWMPQRRLGSDNRTSGSTESALARRSTTSIETARVELSTLDTYTCDSPAFSARYSCDQLRATRRDRTLVAKRFRRILPACGFCTHAGWNHLAAESINDSL